MITIFSMPKAFAGEFKTIQERAIQSWLTATRPRPEIILLGDEKGTAAMCKKYGLRHIAAIEKNSFGTPLLSDMFNKAEQEAHYHYRMYCNADIILEKPIQDALKALTKSFDTAVASGRRYESETGKLKGPSWLDYFIFSKGAFGAIPPFALGKTFWDKWLLWQALKRNIPVVDLTECIEAVHQTHGYSYAGNTAVNVWTGREALGNIRLAGGWSHGKTLDSATWIVKHGRLIRRKKSPLSLTDTAKILIDKMPLLWPYLLQIRRTINKIG